MIKFALTQARIVSAGVKFDQMVAEREERRHYPTKDSAVRCVTKAVSRP